MSDIISIIIPIYNTEKYLVESLESISNQTYKNIEILLINDGSSDNSKVICEKYCNIDKRFKYFENTNHGVSYSRNFGIKKSSGKYLVFVDSDDVIAKNFIELLYNNLINNMADCSICGIKGFNLSAEIEESSTIGDTYLEQELFINLFNKYGGFLANKMYKKDIIERYELYLDEKIHICEDLLFNLSYFECCKKVVYSNEIKYFYRMHNNSSFYNLKNEKWFTIIDTYNYILDKYINHSKALKNIIVFNSLMIVYEAKERVKLFNNKTSYINKINELERKCLSSKSEFVINQKIKLFLFKKFPSIIMKYKRYKLDGGI